GERRCSLVGDWQVPTRYEGLMRKPRGLNWKIEWQFRAVDDHGSHPLFADTKRLLLDMAPEQSLPELLRLIASRLGDSPRVALVRICLANPPADCTDCPTVEQCRGQSRCLYLVASSGRSAAAPSTKWTRLDGAFRRSPFGARKVGQIAASGE